MAHALDEDHNWASEIGRVVMAFGEIENVTMLCLRSLPKDPIYLATSHMNLTPRIELLIAILSAHKGRGPSELAALLSEAKKLAETRNLIVHNPLVLDVFESESGEYLLERSISSTKDMNKRLSLPELMAAREKAEALARRLYAAASVVLENYGARDK